MQSTASCRRVPALVALVAGALAAGALAAATSAADLVVESTVPTPRSIGAPAGTVIAVTFDRPLRPATVTTGSFWAFGRWSGAAAGKIAFADGNRTALLTPDEPFSHGESVMVILSNSIEAEDGSPMRPGGFSFQFWTRSLPARMEFEQIDVMSTRSNPDQGTRAYGGIGSDLNHDRFLDLTIVNEDTSDLRVFLNRADGTGLFHDFIEPPFPVGDHASPSEPHDFDRDGNTDICVVDFHGASVSILLGRGDGTFGPRQVAKVGGEPRGIAVLDADGDGDVDIVNTNAASNNLSLLRNDGAGVFGPAVFFDGGVSGEWALASADMDGDGLLDLVVSGETGAHVAVAIARGDGTFAPRPPIADVGRTWMHVCGDVNGDGAEDVATVNGSDGTARILLGDGAGNLAFGDMEKPDPFPIATDLADLDGDGDLDWITSCFQGDWFVYANDGTGSFSFDQELPAPDAASCSIVLDFDNDGDLDLALVDENDDTITLMRAAGTPCPADLDASGDVGFDDLLAVLAAWGLSGAPEDLDGSGIVDFGDLLIVLAGWGECP